MSQLNSKESEIEENISMETTLHELFLFPPVTGMKSAHQHNICEVVKYDNFSDHKVLWHLNDFISFKMESNGLFIMQDVNRNWHIINGLLQERRNSSMLEMGLHLFSCTKPWICDNNSGPN